MTATLLDWWGFRVRTPLDYTPPDVSRLEITSAGLLFATVAQFIWWVWLVLGPLPVDPGLAGILRDQAVVPLLFLLGAIGLMHALPRSLLDRLGVTAVLVLSREKGATSGWDMIVAAMAVVLAVAAALRGSAQPWALATMVVVLTAGAASVSLARFQPSVDFSKRRWRFEVPEWLREGEGWDGIIPADVDASPIYDFAVAGGISHKVGIHLPTEALGGLRRINSEHSGGLFRENPLAVVLMDRPPAEGLGREHLGRLCRQLGSAARHHGLTRFQTAGVVLAFVQKAIRYGFDHDTTSSFPGGPFPEYGRFALETIHDQVGDCDCTAILCASILAGLGYRTALIFVSVREDDGTTAGHLAVGLSVEGLLATEPATGTLPDLVAATDGSGEEFLYGESACDGFALPWGQIPAEWKSRLKVDSVLVIPAM